MDAGYPGQSRIAAYAAECRASWQASSAEALGVLPGQFRDELEVLVQVEHRQTRSSAVAAMSRSGIDGAR